MYFLGEKVPNLDDLSFFNNIEDILRMKYNPSSSNSKIELSGLLLCLLLFHFSSSFYLYVLLF